MSTANHGWGYRISLVLITLLLMVPQAFYVYEDISNKVSLWSWSGNWSQSFMLPSIPGLNTRNHYYCRFSHALMWRGQIVDVRPNSQLILAKKQTGWHTVTDYALAFSDPESGQAIDTPIELPNGHHRPVVLDDRLFLIARPERSGSAQCHEFVDGQLKPIDFLWADYDPLILIDGGLSRIESSPAYPKLSVSTVESGKWTPSQNIVLPTSLTDFSHTHSSSGLDEAGNYGESRLSVVNDKGQIHAFVFHERKLYYRRGLTLQVDKDSDETTTYGAGESTLIGDVRSVDDWTQVCDPAQAAFVRDYGYGALVDGVPVALLVDGVESHRPTGFLYRLDGSDWRETATIPFPYGSNRFNLISSSARQTAYIVATSSTGTGFAYRWEADGIHEVSGHGPALTWTYVKRDLWRFIEPYGIIVVLGLLPGIGITLITDWRARSVYTFGNRTVQLAPICYRAMARLIDLLLIGAIAAMIAIVLLKNVNWYEVAESYYLEVDHPDLHRLHQAGRAVVITFVIGAGALVLIQGIWSVTPGKWICGLRTVQTTLRPCGIARSLARELLFFVDSTYLLWSVPGSLTAGLTHRRQRLGDLVGGTIIVRSRTWKPADVSRSNQDVL